MDAGTLLLLLFLLPCVLMLVLMVRGHGHGAGRHVCRHDRPPDDEPAGRT